MENIVIFVVEQVFIYFYFIVMEAGESIVFLYKLLFYWYFKLKIDFNCCFVHVVIDSGIIGGFCLDFGSFL
jgi:hypothetical protein